jgi:hypothetical protein
MTLHMGNREAQARAIPVKSKAVSQRKGWEKDTDFPEAAQEFFLYLTMTSLFKDRQSTFAGSCISAIRSHSLWRVSPSRQGGAHDGRCNLSRQR